ncbi:MAG: hypothetical protein QG646_4577 [Euryarchaeota archaeon]|nr:hypothetical protein [Euryarchaeota archaeon]
MYCSNCGLKVDTEDVFCSGCGAKLKTKLETEEYGSQMSAFTESTSSKKVNSLDLQKKSVRYFFPKDTWILVFICFFGCLFIVSSIFVLIPDQYFYGNSSDVQNKVQMERNIQTCEQIAAEYYKSHTYSEDDIYDCDDMAQDIWNMLKAKGVNARIAAGDFEKKSTSGIEGGKPVHKSQESGNPGKIETYNYTCQDTGLLNSDIIDNLTHAWVLAEVSPGYWLAVECTGGYIVYNEEDGNYYHGLTFSNPKNYRSFLELYSNWKRQIKDYENERAYYNKLIDKYNSASNSEQTAIKINLEVQEERLQEKQNNVLKTDSEIQALLRYG